MRRSFLLLIALALLIASCGGDDDDGGDSPTPTPDTGELPRPVILVPGVAGSQLVSGNQEHWAAVSDQVFSVTDDFLNVLALPGDGIPAGDTTHGDIIRTESIEIGGLAIKEADFYGTIIERFEAEGHAEGEQLFIFPYDWRIDISTEAGRLRAFIDDVLDDTEAEQVDIVAHSMGGLVTLDALQDDGMEGKVAKLVTLGTPVLGATKALGVIEYKAVCFTEEIFDVHCITNPSTAQQVMLNFPASYLLLPSRDFQNAVGSPLELEGVEVSYDEWSGIVRANRNGALLDGAIGWQSQLAVRPDDPEVEMLRVVGSDRGTPVQIERFTINDCFFFRAGFCPEKLVTKVIAGPGDGTVPRASAGLHDDGRGFDRREGVENHYVEGVGHMGLSQDSDVIDVLFAFLRGESEARIASSAGYPVAAQLIEDDAEPFEGTSITVIGPAWGAIDSGEETTGPVAGAEVDIIYEGISGSSLWRGGNAQTFVFSDPGSYTAEFTMPSPGSEEYGFLEQQAAPEGFISEVILIEIERYRDDGLNDSAIYRIEPKPGMRISFDFDTGGDPDEVTVRIDSDGDGEPDSEAEKVPNREPLKRIATPTAEPSPTPSATPSPTASPTATSTPTPTPTPTPSVISRQLLRVGPGGELAPDIITSWEIAGDASEIILILEEGLRLEGGQELTSKALIEIVESHANEFIEYEYIGSEAIDDFTVIVLLGTSRAEEFLAIIGKIEVVLMSG